MWGKLGFRSAGLPRGLTWEKLTLKDVVDIANGIPDGAPDWRG
jgi:hypothetical protein